MRVESYQSFFSAVANPTRLRIITLLRERPRAVKELCAELGLEQSRVSHSLRCLSHCGFVQAQPNGRERIYHLAGPTVLRLFETIDAHIEDHRHELGGCEVIHPLRSGGLSGKGRRRTP
jgi:DNA-binding transcriptional ArsR family regulator